jgi:hypothetical protein
MAKSLTINTADLMAPTLDFHVEPSPLVEEPFPAFEDSFPPSEASSIFDEFPVFDHNIEVMSNLPSSSPTNKLVERISNPKSPERQPSPQPTHFSVPHNGNGHRVLRSATVGYVAPEFKGKKAQMVQGESSMGNYGSRH